MVLETAHTYEVFFSLPFLTYYELWKCEVGAFFRGLIRRTKFKNLSSTRNKFRDEMENKCAYVVSFFVYNNFSFEIGFSLEPLFTQNAMINIFLPTHPPKTSDWCFAKWQNGYKLRPLINIFIYTRIHCGQFLQNI